MDWMWLISAIYKGKPPSDLSILLSDKSKAEKKANNGFSENEEL